MIIKILLFILLFAFPCFAQEYALNSAIIGLAGGSSVAGGIAGHCDDATHNGAGAAILLCEDFDGSSLCATDYTSTCQNTWTVTLQAGDALDFDNASAPAPLQGTYSARLTSAGESASELKKSYAASDSSYVFARYNFDSIGSTATFRFFLGILGSGSEEACLVGVDGSDHFALYSVTGGLSSSTVDVSADTDYCIWLEHVKNTSCVVYVAAYSSGCTKPGSPTHTHSGGGENVQGAALLIRAVNSFVDVLDYIRVNSSAFGNDPQ